MVNFIKKFWSNEDGNIGIMGVIGGSTVLAASALAIEANMLFGSQASLQSAMDAATLAAGSVDPSVQDSTAREVFDLAVGDVPITFADDGVTITREGEFIVGRAEGTVDSLFGGILMPETVTVSAKSVVGFTREVGTEPEGTVEEVGTRACIISLAEGQGLTLNSGARINAPECEVHVHAINTPVSHNNGARADISKLCIAGSSFGNNNANGNNRLDPDQVETNCDVAPDPYVDAYPQLDASTCDFNNFSPNSLGSKNSRANMQPGVYCGDSNFNSGGGDYTMDPGVYVIKGRWNVNGGNDIYGEGITIYYEGQNSVIQLNSGAKFDATAPSTGDFANFVMVEKAGLSNPSQFVLNGGNHVHFDGIMHLPSRNVTLNSGSRSTSTALVANKIIVNSGARLNIEPKNYFPPVPGETYAQVPPEEGQVATNTGEGTEAGDGSDVERVASSEGLPFLASTCVLDSVNCEDN